jgi:para-aminobenzoate synthetase component 1
MVFGIAFENLVPMNAFELDIEITHEILLRIVSLFAEVPGTCLLYSGGNLDSAHYSFLYLFPYNTCVVHEEKNAWELLKDKIVFGTSWVGFLAYEMGLEGIGLNSLTPMALPKAYFQQSAFCLRVDHLQKRSTIKIENEKPLSEYGQEWLKKLSDVNFWPSFIDCLDEVLPVKPLRHKTVKDFDNLDTYVNKILDVQEKIKHGQVYQVNLSHETEILSDAKPFSVFLKIMRINPAPFAAYFKHENFTIVSSSPERFLKKENGLLETRPIKGTISRGKNEVEDQDNLRKLLNSEKDLSELLMITDLMRNDLGKISLPGSVKVIKLAHHEAYANVYHLLSIIEATPYTYMHPVDIIKACFPGGSVTGCPKPMSMKVIQQLEKRTRGIYTGSIGYINEKGDFDFNIAIRTLFFSDNKINIQLGGAITIDSDGKSEYLETMEKGDSIFQSLT